MSAFPGSLEHLDESRELISCQYLPSPAGVALVDQFAVAEESRDLLFESENAWFTSDAARFRAKMRFPDCFAIRRCSNYQYGHLC